MTMINFVLSWVEHEYFYNLGASPMAGISLLRDKKEPQYWKKTSLFVGISVFMSSWNCVLSGVEHEKSFKSLGLVFLCPGLVSLKHELLEDDAWFTYTIWKQKATI